MPPNSYPVSYEAKGLVRRFKADIARRSNRTHEMIGQRVFDELAQAFMFKSGKGRDRALARIRSLMPARFEYAKIKPRRLLFSQLCCTEHLMKKPRDPGEAQA